MKELLQKVNSTSGYEKSALYYDLFAQKEDIPFYLEYAKKQKSPILDLAAGTGRVTIPIAKAGYKIYSLESSEAMYNQAKMKISLLLKEVKEKITLLKGNMISFQLDKKFNLIIIPTSFGHCLTTEQQESCLRNIYNHLSEKGIFILDLFPGGTLKEKGFFRDKSVKINQEREIIRLGKYSTDFIKQISNYELKYEIYEKGKLIDEIIEHSEVAVIFNREIDLLLKKSGFKIREQYCNWEKEHYKPSIECKRRILVLTK